MSETLFEVYEIEDRGASWGHLLPGEGASARGGPAAPPRVERGSAPRSLETARVERDDAMQRVSDHAPVEWKDEAWTWLVRYLRTHAEFFPDDAWNEGLSEPPNARAFGPVVQRAARQGLIVKAGRLRPRTRGHATRAEVWTSTLYRQESS